jgi:sarcosine oxidase
MSTTYDAIVLGLGGMGSATAYQLALRGKRVLGLEQFPPAHDRGSSHGHSRVIRQAYFEDPAYVPLLLRAYELWRQIERETGATLLTVTGGLMIGPPDSQTVQGARHSAEEWGLEYEMLDAAEIHRRFPPLTPDPSLIALYERAAGFVRPEAGVRAHLKRAAELGADLHFEEPATRWEAADGGGVRVTTARGAYEAERLILSAGAWAPHLLADLGVPLTIERQVLYWFDPVGGVEPFLPDRFPIYIWEVSDDVQFYGFPSQAGEPNAGPGGAKVAFFRDGKPGNVDPDALERSVTPAETDRMRAALADRIPVLNAPLLGAVACMYTLTPDHHFIIAPHPAHPQVIVASPCSGHGYKFCSVVGEILADLATDGATRHPISLFAPDRPALVTR